MQGQQKGIDFYFKSDGNRGGGQGGGGRFGTKMLLLTLAKKERKLLGNYQIFTKVSLSVVDPHLDPDLDPHQSDKLIFYFCLLTLAISDVNRIP